VSVLSLVDEPAQPRTLPGLISDIVPEYSPQLPSDVAVVQNLSPSATRQVACDESVPTRSVLPRGSDVLSSLI